MTGKSVELDEGKITVSEVKEKPPNNSEEYSETSVLSDARIKACSQDNLAVNYNGQQVPMILVEQASLVSAFPYTAEDPVYTPPTENSTTTPGCSMDESLPSLLEHQKSTVSFSIKEKRCPKKKKGPWYIPSVTCIPIIVIVILIGMVVMVPIILDNQKFVQKQREGRTKCTDSCNAILAESIPMNLTYPDGSKSHPSIYSNLMMLLGNAKKSLKIASSYWSLRNEDVSDLGTNTSWQGENVFREIYNAGKFRGIKIQIAQDMPREGQDDDTKLLKRDKAAEVRSLNFKRVLGAGILHTKMWLVDDEHFYLGSANMDWRSLTQVKEIGIIVTNCSCMAKDLAKIFDVYWVMGGFNGSLPKHPWPAKDITRINSTSPLEVEFNGLSKSLTYFSSSPPQLSPEGREEDIDAILNVIQEAEKFVHIAVMDFVPVFLYSRPRKYWPVINDALKVAAIDRGVEVQVLMSNWTHTRSDIVKFLKSFQAIDGAFGARVQVRLFTVPSFDEKQAKIPFARVNHNKYMVTEKCAYIGTSNWSADYFVNTGGIGIVVNQSLSAWDPLGNSPNLRSQLADIFQRDWTSSYAGPLPD